MTRNQPRHPLRCSATRSGQGGGSYRECGLPPIWFGVVVMGLFGLASMVVNAGQAVIDGRMPSGDGTAPPVLRTEPYGLGHSAGVDFRGENR